MTDYTKTQSYTPKDALTSGDAEKLILGSDWDAELDLIVTAIASKYDSSDIATQAQAEAGVNNTTLMTPLRVSQYLSGSGAGMVGDIVALTDPNADRGLFWDDSAGAVALFDLGTGLSFSGTTLGLTLAAIDHDSLQNWSANKHIDHTAVTLTAGSGLTGGGDISASRSFSLNIPGLTEDTAPQTSADYVVTYDTSASTHKKVLGDNLVGAAVGDGVWYSSAGQAIPANVQTTVVFDTASYNLLQRGSYSTGTGLYTATLSAGARVHLSVTLAPPALASGRSFTILIIKNGAIIARSSHTASGGSHTTPGKTLSRNITLAFNETCGAAIFFTTSANSVQAGEAYAHMSIVELG